MMLFGFKTQLRDLVAGGIRFKQGMIDHSRQRAIPRDDTDRRGKAFGASADHMPGIIKTGFHFYPVGDLHHAGGARRIFLSLLLFDHRQQHFAGDDLYQGFNGLDIRCHAVFLPRYFFSISMILSTRLACLSPPNSVVSQVLSTCLARLTPINPAPSVSTLASLCSRLFTAVA